MNDLRVHLAASKSSRFRPRGSFELVLDGVAVYSSSAGELFTVARTSDGWTVETGGGASLCPGGACVGDVLQIRTADGVAVESSATRHSYSHGQITLTLLSGAWYRIVLTELQIEHYLRGVAEVPPDWPAEALRAQAVASRTYALHVARENRDSATWRAPFDLYSTTMSQVYSGNTRELSPRNGPWLQAIEDTAGQVLTYDGTPALTLFTTSGGGYTENSGYAYNEQLPYLVAARDPPHLRRSLHPVDPHLQRQRAQPLARPRGRHERGHPAAHRRVRERQRLGAHRPGHGAPHRLGRLPVRDRPALRLRGQQGSRVRGMGPAPEQRRPGGGTCCPRCSPSPTAAPCPRTWARPRPRRRCRAATLPARRSRSRRRRDRTRSSSPGSRPRTQAEPPITGYTITWVSSTGASGTIPETGTTRTLRNLTNSATYTISITASNAAGTSPATTTSATPRGVPSGPSRSR